MTLAARPTRLWIFALHLLLGTVSAHCAAQSPLPTTVAEALQRAKIPESAVSIYVQDVTQNNPQLALNAERAMNPASVMKLLTTFAALEVLGPAYRWNTEVYYQGALQDEKLKGDLIFKGYGDPKVTLENFWLMLRDLRQRGIKDIRGNLILDRTHFEVPNEDPAAFDNEPYKPYNVSPDPLLLNFRAHRIRFLSASKTPNPQIAIDPELPNRLLVNNVKRTKGVCGDWKEQIRYQVGATINFTGQYADACEDRSLLLVLSEKNDYFSALFKQLWESLGGTWKGQVVEGRVPEQATLLANFNSPDLTDILRDINKYSNNVMARNLYLSIGVPLRGAPATPKKSAEAINDWLAVKGQNFLELIVDNGSGLSRSERISAQHMAWLLRSAFQSKVFSEFESSLPIVAVDGTMRKRLSLGAVSGQAHIKSGSLNGVRAIAGYVFDAQGRRMLVVFFINHAQAEFGRAAQDALLEWVYAR